MSLIIVTDVNPRTDNQCVDPFELHPETVAASHAAENENSASDADSERPEDPATKD